MVLDANGQATSTVPLNDSLTTFRIVAVADAGAGLFGTGQASIRVTQDLQIISGLPPLVREDDQFRAQLTLRNTTAKAMKVRGDAAGTRELRAPPRDRRAPSALPAQDVDVAAGEAREVAGRVTCRAEALSIAGRESRPRTAPSGARDALKARQRIVPAVPLRGAAGHAGAARRRRSRLPVARAGRCPADGGQRGGLNSPCSRGWPRACPACATGSRPTPSSAWNRRPASRSACATRKLWQAVVAQLPTYLDGDGLANYFPPRDGEANRRQRPPDGLPARGHARGRLLDPAFALPDAARADGSTA